MLKFIVDDINTVPEALRSLYTQRPSDSKWVLQVEGAVDAARLAEFRDSNILLTKRLEDFKDIDPAKARELIGMEKDIRNGKVKDGKTVEEIVEERTTAMRKAHETEVATLKKDLEGTTGKLSRLTIADAAVAKATELGLRPSAREDLVERANRTFTLKEGNPVALDPTGQPKFGKHAEPLTIGEYVEGLIETAPHLFDPSTGTGAAGGSKNNGGGAAGVKVNPWLKPTFNLTKQGEVYRANPDLARKMAAEAGVKLA